MNNSETYSRWINYILLWIPIYETATDDVSINHNVRLIEITI